MTFGKSILATLAANWSNLLNEKRELIFSFIITYKSVYDGCAPSLDEIAFALDIPKSTVNDYVRHLKEDGLLDSLPGKPGGIMVRGGSWSWQPTVVHFE